MLLTGTKFTSPQGRLENTMDKSFEQAMQIRAKRLEVEKTAEIESTITELVSITNRSRIYGSRIILGTNRMETDEIADLLNRSLSAIQTLRRIIQETLTLQKDADCKFIITQSERKKMINFIYKNLERPVYIPIHLDYGVWLNNKSVGKLRELVINACEIIEMKCTSGLLEWQEAIEQFPKIFDDRGDVIVGEEWQLEA